MTDYTFITVDELDDDKYDNIPCTDIKEFDFISMEKHLEESGILCS